MDIDYEKTSSVYAETLPTGRTYFTPDGDFPSITTLLGKTSDNQVWLQKWRERVGEEEANRISKEATDRGTLIHEYAEKYFQKSIGFKIPLDIETEECYYQAIDTP